MFSVQADQLDPCTNQSVDLVLQRGDEGTIQGVLQYQKRALPYPLRLRAMGHAILPFEVRV